MSNKMRKSWLRLPILALLLVTTGAQGLTSAQAQPQPNCRNFQETGMQVCGIFLQYWDEHGGLTQQGLPLTSEFNERSDTDGKTYRVQYFERAVFEAHPENKPLYNILLSLLGSAFYSRNYPTGAPRQEPNTEKGSILFPQTGMRLGGRFLEYWRANGGLMQQGYPISNEFSEKSALNGQTYTVQYFERAVFEYHPENKPPFDVLLSQLGTYYFKLKYGSGAPDDWTALRQRPLQLNPIKAISPCPVSEARIVAPEFGLAAGNGPIYALGLSAEANSGVLYYGGARQEGGWFYYKVVWAGSPTFKGPVLVRGRQLDGARELRFGEGPDPAKELTLRADNTGAPGFWSNWPTEMRFQGQGCYAFQVDTPDATEVIVFKAVENR